MSVTRAGQGKARPWLYGAVFGLAVAAALEIWRRQAMSRTNGEGLEGVWLTAAGWSIRLGFPLNIVTILSLDVLSPMFSRLRLDPFFLLLLGIVVNWALVSAVLTKLFRRFGCFGP